MQEHTLTIQGIRLFYRTAGKGKPVVLLHGFGEDGDIWNRQVTSLKDHYRLIIPDIPGSGRSEMMKKNSTPVTIENYAGIIKELLDHEYPDQETLRYNIFGHSMGGYIALAFAALWPEKMASLGLVHSTAYADTPEKITARERSIDFIRETGAAAFLKTSIPGLFRKMEDGTQPAASFISELVNKGNSFTGEALVQYYRAMIERPNRTAVLKNFPGPVLFLIGEHDQAVPLESSLKQCYLPRESHVHLLSASAHMGMIEETEKTNRFLLEFLESMA